MAQGAQIFGSPPFFTLSFNPRRGDAYFLSMSESGI